jgi:thiamine pyrophosphate-dependent acetolactate synthase large subunit-like protein
MTRGFRIAQAAPKGPVAFEMGIDLLLTMDDIRQYYWGGYFPQHLDYLPEWRMEETAQPVNSGADPLDVEKAAKIIAKAKKPFMIIGDYGSWDDAGPECQEFTELTAIPFNTRRLGRAVVSEQHYNAMRGFPPFRDEFDLMIPVGLKVGFFDGYAGGWPESIQVAPCESYVWTYIKTACTLMGNTKTVMRQLNDALKAMGYKPDQERLDWLERCRKAKQEAEERRAERAYRYGPDHPRYKKKDVLHFGYCSHIIREVNKEMFDSKVRVMIDGYTMSDFVMPFLEFTRPASCITANDQAGVGHGMGQAIGAAFADLEQGIDDIPVLGLMGDSGMMNAGMDFEVAVRFQLPCVYMVSNNSGWMPGMKYPWYGPNWDILGEQDVVGATWKGRTQLGEERPIEVHFEKLAEVHGGAGMLCNRAEKFRDQLKEAYDIAVTKKTPVIMNCIMDQHLVNRAVTGPVYVLMYAHIPWNEVPKRGQHARRTYLGKWFKGLTDMPDMPPFDPWEPLTEEEMTYKPVLDYFK